MSISKTIIYGSDSEVSGFLKTDPALDVIDEYGYTPLIQTAIINSVSKAKILLSAGLNVDFPDLTGRSALFWAADNGNLELCKLLLKYGANTNEYSSGGQPLLVMPYMKRQEDIKSLLISSGANLDFAQDFLNAKIIGHIFELEGRVDIVDTKNTFIEVELEGFYLRFTLEIIANSLIEFKNHFVAKKVREYFDSLDIIIASLKSAISLIQLQHYLVDIDSFLQKINSLLDAQPLILPISFGGHAISLIKYYDTFVRCDRGQYGKENGTVIYYEMQRQERLTKTLCRNLIYKRQHVEYVNNGLSDYLGLQPKQYLDLPVQKTGNCSWANAESIIPAIMYLLLCDKRGHGSEKASQKDALAFYKYWSKWNQSRSLEFCAQTIKTSSPARAATKAALLASILFQSCSYENKEDRNKANKILSILTKAEYIHLLRCYAKVYYQDKDNALWKNFCNYLEDFGVNLDDLLHF